MTKPTGRGPGAPRKPSALKDLEGTTRKDRTNPNEPKPVMLEATTPVPAWLKGDRQATAAWEAVLPMLVGMRVATIADQLSIGLLCEAMGRFLACRDVVRKKGRTYTVKMGTGSIAYRERPEVRMMETAWQQVRGIMGEFGLTPSARTRVSTTDPGPIGGGGGRPQPTPDVDPFEAWMARDASGA